MADEKSYNYEPWLEVGTQAANMAYDGYNTKKGREWAAQEAEKNRNFQVEMYNRQLSDSIDWREHQEIYNSPAAQMQRFADAGINPMYFVTGANGGNTIHTPSLTGGFGSTPVSPQTPTGRLSVSEAVRLNNETRITRGQEHVLEAEARLKNAEAQNQEYKHGYGQYFNDVWNIYRGIRTQDNETMAQDRAYFMDAARMYEWRMLDLTFEDAKAAFEHSKEVRAFAKDLNDHQRNLFEHELSQAKSAAEIFRVSAKWAIPNQWINAGSQVLGAAAGVARAFNVPKTTVQKTITSYDNSERHIYGDYQYKPQSTTINDPNW